LEIAIIIFVGVFLLLVAVSPAWLMWLLAARFLPADYSMPPNKMALGCIFLSFLTAALLNVELEGGALSIPAFVVAFSVLWSLLLIPSCSIAKYLIQVRRSKST